MKDIKEARFQKRKPESIAFNPEPVPGKPVPTEKSSGERTDERSNVRSEVEVVTAIYVITIPKERRKTRQSFDIFEDQYDALKKLQIVEKEHSGNKSPKLGKIVQEAIDKYIQEKAKRLSNITINEEE